MKYLKIFLFAGIALFFVTEVYGGDCVDNNRIEQGKGKIIDGICTPLVSLPVCSDPELRHSAQGSSECVDKIELGHPIRLCRDVEHQGQCPTTLHITLIGSNPIYHNKDEAYNDPGATAEDDVYGDLTSSIQSISDVDTSRSGTYQVIYTVTSPDNKKKNIAVAIRNVVVALNVPDQYPTINDAIFNAVDGDTILLAPGTYNVNETLTIDKHNLTIASEFLYSGDESDIDNTIIIGDPNTNLIEGKLNGVDPDYVGGDSTNLKIIGLTIKNADKAVTFTDDYGEVHYCKFYNTSRDTISFDLNAGGAVTHCYIENAGDDAIDIDTRHDGSFLIAYNEIITPNDDGIEVHNYSHTGINMHYDIHDNLISGVRWEDGIQIIDFDSETDRTYDIYRNIFENNINGVGISTMYVETKEDFQGAPMTERVRIYNNYFYNNLYHITGGDNMIILNNIFDTSSVAVHRAKTDSITDYNLFYNNDIDNNDTLTGADNLTSDPKSDPDYTLRSDSPAIDAGTAEYIHNSETVLTIPANEYNGAAPDMGRYEY